MLFVLANSENEGRGRGESKGAGRGTAPSSGPRPCETGAEPNSGQAKTKQKQTGRRVVDQTVGKTNKRTDRQTDRLVYCLQTLKIDI